ncbi:MAG: carboxypeptidase-like regulatory domain-containing protein, partial [Candidatus Eremiobacteraeota bacterium]|nr:carboxypeptidase-like regulatory domain-containing protein [Candidatus Eremiobacteraeota bacterium]
MAFAATVVVWMQSPAAAVSTGSLSGTVSDDKGTPISGAQVSAVSTSGNYRATTGKSGFYIILNMTPETYTITFSAQGYDPTSISG